MAGIYWIDIKITFFLGPFFYCRGVGTRGGDGRWHHHHRKPARGDKKRGRSGNNNHRPGRQPASVDSQHATANTSEDWGHTLSTMEQLRHKIAKMETTLLQQIRHKKQQLDEARAMARTLDQLQSEAAGY